MKVPESLPKLLQAVKWSSRDDVAQVCCSDVMILELSRLAFFFNSQGSAAMFFGG